jgi:hypothetical protein
MHHSNGTAFTGDVRVSPVAPGSEFPDAAPAPREKGPQVSKSDQQLFGPLSGIVRQLGVAASAAADARTLMRERADDIAGLTQFASALEHRETGEQSRSLLTLLWELEDHAARIHRHVAEQAIREYRTTSGCAGSSVGRVPDLTAETISAAVDAHPMRDIGVLIAVADDLRETVARLWMEDYENASKTTGSTEPVNLHWAWTVDEKLAIGRWDIRSKH